MRSEEVYAKQNGVLLEKEDGKFYIVFNYSVYEVNEIGARILDLCSGSRTVSDIAMKLSDKFNVNYDNVLKDVEAYVDMLKEKSIINLING